MFELDRTFPTGCCCVLIVCVAVLERDEHAFAYLWTPECSIADSHCRRRVRIRVRKEIKHSFAIGHRQIVQRPNGQMRTAADGDLVETDRFLFGMLAKVLDKRAERVVGERLHAGEVERARVDEVCLLTNSVWNSTRIKTTNFRKIRFYFLFLLC